MIRDFLLSKIYSIDVSESELDDERRRIAGLEQPKFKMAGFRPGTVNIDLILRLNSDKINDDAMKSIITRKVIDLSKQIKYIDGPYMFIENNTPMAQFITIPDSLELSDKSIVKYNITISEEDIDEEIRRLGKIKISNKEKDIVEVGDIVEVEVNITSYKESNISVSRSIICSESHWSRGKNVGFKYLSFLDADVLEDIGGDNLSFFSTKESIIKKIIKSEEEIKIDSKLAKALGYKTIESMRTEVHKNLLSESNKASDYISHQEALSSILKENKFNLPRDFINKFDGGLSNIVFDSFIRFIRFVSADSGTSDINKICNNIYGSNFNEMSNYIYDFINAKCIVKLILFITLYPKVSMNEFTESLRNFSFEDEMRGLSILLEKFKVVEKNILYKELLEIVKNSTDPSIEKLVTRRK